MGSFWKMGAATALFAILHSALASRAAKEAAARVLGERRRDASYRPLFNAQAVFTFALLTAYAGALPKRTLYRARGPLAAALRCGQTAGLVYAFWAARQVGIARVTGLDNLLRWSRHEELLPPPAAQGPERLPDGRLSVSGPFLWNRHPLNLSPVPVLWLTPHMTSRRLSLSLFSTLYLVLGSWHEEKRLREAYGEEYESYRRSGVPFYIPRIRSLPSEVS